MMAALDRRGGSLRKRELIEELGLDRVRPGDGSSRPPTAQAQHSRLRHRLDPLEHRWGFVSTDGRAPVAGFVSPTKDGWLLRCSAARGGPLRRSGEVHPFNIFNLKVSK